EEARTEPLRWWRPPSSCRRSSSAALARGPRRRCHLRSPRKPSRWSRPRWQRSSRQPQRRRLSEACVTGPDSAEPLPALQASESSDSDSERIRIVQVPPLHPQLHLLPVSLPVSLPPVLSDGEEDVQVEKESKNFPERPSVEEVTVILPEDIELKPLGNVSSITEQLVIIESLTNMPPVNEDTVIFKSDRQAAGKVFEIFGPVAHPFYGLWFNSSNHIGNKGIKIKDTMYFAPSMKDFTQYIFLEKLKQDRGSDASWKNDQEPPPEALDFSDDEKEKEGKQRKKSQIQGQKKLKSELNESGEDFGEVHQNWNAYGSPSEYSRGYHNREFTRGFTRGRYSRGNHSRPPLQQLYNSDQMASQETLGFPPQRQDNPVMPHYPFPPPMFDMHNFSLPPPPPLPPPSVSMGWTGPNMASHPLLNLPYFLPPPLPLLPPPPPSPGEGKRNWAFLFVLHSTGSSGLLGRSVKEQAGRSL
ncbi:hypothetical protein U0070_009470, partial [Myodes glareolus]